MTAERYKKIYNWFSLHPAQRQAVVFLNRLLPAVPFVCYPLLLCLLGARWLMQGLAVRELLRAVFVPGATFLGGTLLRGALNRPRPYEQPGFVPLVHKKTKGKSFPSRHALSAAVLAVTWLYYYPAAGVGMTALALVICALRVLAGVHHGRDVLSGALLGFACGIAGMFWI